MAQFSNSFCWNYLKKNEEWYKDYEQAKIGLEARILICNLLSYIL